MWEWSAPKNLTFWLFRRFLMSGAIILSFPQAPLVVPKLVARPMEQPVALSNTDGSKAASPQVPVSLTPASKLGFPNDATGGMVNLKA